MSANEDRIVSEALELAPEARAIVAEKLIESLDAEPIAELFPAWREEIRKRCEEIDRGARRTAGRGGRVRPSTFGSRMMLAFTANAAP
jgi:hypothetical protein